jgi:hypothetical protein
MKTYNTIIIGGGASGILAGIYLDDSNSILLEQNEKLGKKNVNYRRWSLQPNK